MTREEILAGIARLEPWFHAIDLGGGISTKSRSIAGEPLDHPLSTWRTVGECLPPDLAGKSLLDVGCNAGFYCIAAKRRGAGRVIGVDVNRLHIRQALFVRRLLGLEVEFRRASVYELTESALGSFDVVLGLGLIYHCKHLVLALENLWQATRELLILETVVYPRAKPLRRFDRRVVGDGHPIHNLGYVDNPPGTFEAAFNWFLPSIHALLALLRTIGVESPEVFAAQGHRAVVVCRKGPNLPDSRAAGRLGARLTLLGGAAECRPGAELIYQVRAVNTGATLWLAAALAQPFRGAVYLGGHLFTADGEEVHWDWARAALPADLRPGDAVELAMRARAPERPGRYRIEVDMVDEHIAWFEDLGSPILRLQLVVWPP